MTTLPIFVVLIAAVVVVFAVPTGASTSPSTTTSSTNHQNQRWWRAQAVNALQVSNGAFTELVSAATQLVTATASGVDSVHSLLSEKTSVYSEVVHRTLYGGESSTTAITGRMNPHKGVDLDGEGGAFGVLSERLAALRPDSLLHVSGATQKGSYQRQVDTMSERVAAALTASQQQTQRQGSSSPPAGLGKESASTPTSNANRIAAEKRRVLLAKSSLAARQDVSEVGSRPISLSVSDGSKGPGGDGALQASRPLLVYDEASTVTTTSPQHQQQHLPQVAPKVYTNILSGRKKTTTSTTTSSKRSFTQQATTSSGTTYTASDYVSISYRGTFCEEGAVAVPGSLLDDSTTFLCTYTDVSSVTKTDLFSAREFLNNQSTIFTSDAVRRTCLVKFDKVVCACAADATLFYNTDEGKKKSVCINSPLTCTTDIVYPVQTCIPRDPEWEHTAAPLLVSDGCLSASRTATNNTFEYQLSCIFPLSTNESSVGYYIPGEQELLAVSRSDVGKYPPVDPAVDALYVILNATEGATFSSAHLPTYDDVQHDADLTYNAIRRSNLTFPYIYRSDTNTTGNISSDVNSAITASLSFTALNPLVYDTPISLRLPGSNSHITRAYFVDGFYNFNILSDRSQQFRIYLDDVAATASGEAFAVGGTLFWTSFIELLGGERTIHRRFDFTNITDESFYAGGRLYGEMGMDGASAAGDRAIVVIDITDAPRGNYQKPKKALNLALVAGVAIIGAILLAGAVYMFKEWRARREVEKNRVHAHLLISNDYH